MSSILDDNYYHLTQAIYTALDNYAPEGKASRDLKETIKQDISEQSYLFHKRQGLTQRDIMDKNTELAVQDDIAGTYTDVDMDHQTMHKDSDGGGMAFLEPSDELTDTHPYVTKKYKDFDLRERGKRTPIYEAFESYLTNNAKKFKARNDTIITRTVEVIKTIRQAVFEHYQEVFCDPALPEDSPYNMKQISQAHKMADQYVLKGLNAINTSRKESASREESAETLKDLLFRFVDKKKTEDKLKEVPKRLDTQVISEMESIEDLNRSPARN